MKKHDLNKGFTLVELIIYVGILLVVLILLTDILVATFDTKLNSEATSQVAQDGRYIYSKLIYDINKAEQVLVPSELGSTSASLILTKGGNTYSYSLVNGDLNITDAISTDQLNSSDTTISDLLFTRIGNIDGKHTVRINFTITSNVLSSGGQQDVKVFQTTAGLR